MSEQSPAPIRIPKPLSTWKVLVFSLLLPLCVTLVTTASVGLWVLTDHEKESWISNTKFAELYRQLIDWNPACSALFFNGGILAILKWLVGQLKNVKFLRPNELTGNKKEKEPKKRR